MQQKIIKIVFSGGPGVGKTTILNALKNLGYEVRHEVFTEIFSQANKNNAFESLFRNKKKLISDLISLQNQNEKTDSIPKENILFLDRGMHDILGFSKEIEYELNEEELFQIQTPNYNLFVIPEPLDAKFYDQNLVRRQSFQESLVHHKMCVDFCMSYFQDKNLDPKKYILFVPPMDVQKRIQFVLASVKKLNSFQTF